MYARARFCLLVSLCQGPCDVGLPACLSGFSGLSYLVRTAGADHVPLRRSPLKWHLLESNRNSDVLCLFYSVQFYLVPRYASYAMPCYAMLYGELSFNSAKVRQIRNEPIQKRVKLETST